MSDSAPDQSEAPVTAESQPDAPQEGQFPEGQSPADQAAAMKEGVYDPGDHTVDEVAEYASQHPDEVDAILAAEREGKDRSTLTSQLESMTTTEDSSEE